MFQIFLKHASRFLTPVAASGQINGSVQTVGYKQGSGFVFALNREDTRQKATHYYKSMFEAEISKYSCLTEE